MILKDVRNIDDWIQTNYTYQTQRGECKSDTISLSQLCAKIGRMPRVWELF